MNINSLEDLCESVIQEDTRFKKYLRSPEGGKRYPTLSDKAFDDAANGAWNAESTAKGEMLSKGRDNFVSSVNEIRRKLKESKIPVVYKKGILDKVSTWESEIEPIKRKYDSIMNEFDSFKRYILHIVYSLERHGYDNLDDLSKMNLSSWTEHIGKYDSRRPVDDEEPQN